MMTEPHAPHTHSHDHAGHHHVGHANSDHAHSDHGQMAHTHAAHHHDHASHRVVRRATRISLMAMSGLQRVLLALPLLIMLWALALWAMQSEA